MGGAEGVKARRTLRLCGQGALFTLGPFVFRHG